MDDCEGPCHDSKAQLLLTRGDTTCHQEKDEISSLKDTQTSIREELLPFWNSLEHVTTIV